MIAGDLHDLIPRRWRRVWLLRVFEHQPDPGRTLRHIAGLLRPGGWVVAHEQLPGPPPRSHPNLEALTGTWDLMYEVLDRNGVPAGVVEDLPWSARQAGLEVTATSGIFGLIYPR